MPARFRELYDEKPYSPPQSIPHFHLVNGSSPEYRWSPTFGSAKFPNSSFQMRDVVGNPGHYNPVSHRVLTSEFYYPRGVQDWFNGSEHWRQTEKGVFLPLPNIESNIVDFQEWSTGFTAAQLSDWAMDAYNAFITQVPTTVSLPNFLYELREMKGMIPSIDRKSLLNTASNNFLAFEFGVNPFVKDIKAILSLSDAVQKRLKHLLFTQGKKTNLSFERDGVFNDSYSFFRSFETPVVPTITGGPGFYLLNGLEFRRKNTSAHLHIGAKLFQDLQGLSDSLSTLKALSASGGFNSPLRVVWNAIPYSFIVDWFFHVGKILDSLSVQPFGGEYRVTDVGYSVKLESSWSIYQVAYGNQTISGQSLIGACTFKSYTRRQGYPVSSLFITDGLLTPMQLALSAAMFKQRH